ncbi:MAG TPA: hypothetical protein VF120_18135 [Ktedonobacterales bacterium]
MGRSVQFGVSEYTLVFRRVLSRQSPVVGVVANLDAAAGIWQIVRPVLDRPAGRASQLSAASRDGDIAQVLIVPFCSTLALDDLSYERFLRQSGVLADALDLLGAVTLAETDSVETARKEIQSLVMAAEVQYIVDGMSA